MPRATSDRFSRAHKPSPKPNAAQDQSTSGRNPIFNTERFGQHILKNPAIAQACVNIRIHAFLHLLLD
jgi:18S rRNA (adenine1779-N6/adenine1780-N6)-dimethyltransferase